MNKIKNKLSIIVPITIIIFVMIYFVYEFRTQETYGVVIGNDNEYTTLYTLNGSIYNIKLNTKYEIGTNIKLKFKKDFSNFNEIQNNIIISSSKINDVPYNKEDIFYNYYSRAKDIINSMTIDEKIGQLLLIRTPVDNQIDLIKKYNFSGYILFDRDLQNKTKNEIIQNISNYQNNNKYGMIIAIDEEGGDVSRLNNTTIINNKFESPQELYINGGFNEIKKDNIKKNKILTELGINVNLAPVADMSSNKDSYIYNRTFGQNPKLTSKYIETILKSSDSNVSNVLKHFPGYNDNLNTHNTISVDKRSYSEFLKKDFLPFKSGIKSGAQMIMISHNVVNSIDKNNSASISKNVHNILKSDLKFTGIIMSDDLDMNGIYGDNSKSKYVQALMSGNNLIIVSDYESAFNDIKDAYNTNVMSEDLIDILLLKNISWKLSKNLIK